MAVLHRFYCIAPFHYASQIKICHEFEGLCALCKEAPRLLALLGGIPLRTIHACLMKIIRIDDKLFPICLMSCSNILVLDAGGLI